MDPDGCRPPSPARFWGFRRRFFRLYGLLLLFSSPFPVFNVPHYCYFRLFPSPPTPTTANYKRVINDFFIALTPEFERRRGIAARQAESMEKSTPACRKIRRFFDADQP
ncbi:hypothetical protein MTP99_006129 [Tenebrio molitor]|jgi:hypothetical protein|nr:hypothetical protein MTP99_006129 [Tenebrio molitor]